MNFTGHYQHEAKQGKSGMDRPPTPQFPLCRCITVLTLLILQCVGRAEVGFSKEKLIISPYSCLTVSVQKCYWCLRNGLYKVQRIHDQWKCSVAMVTDVRIVIIKPVNNVRSVHRKSVRVTELLYHSDAKPRIGELLCPVSSHFKLLPGTAAVSVSLAYFFSWCLKIVRNNVAGCISALWTANAELAKLEQETLGNTNLWVWPSVRGQKSWVGTVHNITCAPQRFHILSSLWLGNLHRWWMLCFFQMQP